MHVHSQTRTSTHIHAHRHALACVSGCMCVSGLCTQTHRGKCMPVCLWSCTCLASICRHTNTHTQAYVYIHTHTHAHIDTHTHRQVHSRPHIHSQHTHSIHTNECWKICEGPHLVKMPTSTDSIPEPSSQNPGNVGESGPGGCLASSSIILVCSSDQMKLVITVDIHRLHETGAQPPLDMLGCAQTQTDVHGPFPHLSLQSLGNGCKNHCRIQSH